MVTKEEVMGALEKVIDPEIGLSVVDMGLIYGVTVENDEVKIKMTLTTPGCPLGAILVREVEDAVAKVAGVKKVEVKLVWDPPWSPEMMKKPEGK